MTSVSETSNNELTLSAPTIAAVGLVSLAVAMGIGRFAFTPILPMMQEDMGLSVAAGGWLASANYLGYLLGALSAVRLKVRPTTAIRLGLVLIAFSTFAMGFGTSFVAWAIWRTLAGVASAWVLVFVSAWAFGKLARLQRPRLAGVVFAGVGAGIAVAGGVCLVLMQTEAPSNIAWMAFGVLSLLLTLLIWPTFRADEDALAAATAAAPSAKFKWSGESIRLVLCYGAFGFGYIIPATFLPAMAKQIIPDPLVFGWSWPVFGAAAAASTLAAVVLQRTFSNRRLWIGGQMAMAFGVVLPTIWPGIAAILLAALLVGSTLTLITMVALQEGRGYAGAHATQLIAAMTAAFAVGQVAGPIAASLAIWATGSISAVLVVACLFLALSTAGLLAGRRTLPARETPATEET